MSKVDRKTISFSPEVEQLICRLQDQYDEAFGPDNIYFYNINHPNSVIDPCDRLFLTDEQKNCLLSWYVKRGGADDFARRRRLCCKVVSG